MTTTTTTTMMVRIVERFVRCRVRMKTLKIKSSQCSSMLFSLFDSMKFFIVWFHRISIDKQDLCVCVCVFLFVEYKGENVFVLS
jgi:hypothetical protein